MISIEQVKTLRDATGISIMQCRKALEDAGGDMDKALIMLRKKGADIASKKSDRVLGAGIVSSYVHSNGSVGAMVELSCETDFVAKNEEFKSLAYDFAMHVAALSPLYLKVSDISDAQKEKAKEVFLDEVKDKPAAMHEKILQGKLQAYFGEKTLLEQPFVKNPDITVSGRIEAAVQKFGEKIEITKFVRLSVSEK